MVEATTIAYIAGMIDGDGYITINRSCRSGKLYFARTDGQPPMNQRCNVVVAGNGVLLDIREVCVKYDACTDSLQRDLDDGWRILAICVQPDQRRPDYVLGKIGGAR